MELFCKNNRQVKAVDYFSKIAPSYMIDRVLRTLLLFVVKRVGMSEAALRRCPSK